MSVADDIRSRLQAAGAPFKANDSIAEFIKPIELECLHEEVEEAVEALLDALIIDREHDHNSQDTPRRVAKMYLTEVFRGRYQPAPEITEFPNVRKVDEIYTVGPIPVRSACSHHLVPILGSAWIGAIPNMRLIGLSKFNRLTDWIMSRPQIQEEAVAQLADALEEAFEPRGLAVVVKAKHFCCGWRGVRDGSEMVSSVMRGLFRDNEAARTEFFSIIKAQGFA
jgi:GTP cyclohydrolase IA